MNKRTAIFAIVVMVGVAVGYLLLRADSTSDEQAAVSTNAPHTPVEPAPASPSLSPHEGAPTATAPALRPSPAEPDMDLAGKIAGRVYTAEGLPAADAVITATWVPRDGATDAPAVMEAVTGEDGTFVLLTLPLGRHLLLARRDTDSARAPCLLLPHAPVAEVVMVLKPAQSISGVVIGRNRLPVCNAILHPVLNNGKAVSGDNPVGLAVVTNAEGGFEFYAPASGQWEFMVRAPGYSPTLSPRIATGTQDARIELLKGVSVSGRVIEDGTNAPVAGARVQLAVDKVPGPPLAVECNAAGNFIFDAVAPGSYLLEVQTDAHTLPEAPVRLAVPNAPVTNLVLRVVTGGVIRGRAFIEESAEPLVGIEVHARGTGPSPSQRVSRPTGADGSFEFAALPAGEYALYAKWLPGFAMVGRSGDEVIVQLQPGQIVDGVALGLTQGLTAAGRVLDTQRNPVGGADVRGRSEGWQDQQSSAADGSFILANIDPGEVVSVSATTSTAASELMGPLTVPEDGLRDIELVLSKPRDALMAGVVVDAKNRPLPARVIAWPDGGQIVSYPPMDDSDAQGRFVMPNVAPGAYALAVKPGDGEQVTVERVTIEAGQQLRDLRLVYPKEASFAIAGRVVGPDGTAVTCFLTLSGQDALSATVHTNSETTIDGGFRFESLAPGAYGIWVHESPRFQGLHISDVEAGTEDLEIVLEPALRLSGQVVDAAGNAITDFELALEYAGAAAGRDTLRYREFQAVSHPEGRFALDVAEGWYELLVRAKGHETQQFRVGDVTADVPAEDLQIVLQ